jgi:hypothetical protein
MASSSQDAAAASQELTQQQQQKLYEEQLKQQQKRFEEQKELTSQRKALELTFQVAKKEEERAIADARELTASAKEYDEQISGLKDRVGAVTSELSTLKLNVALEKAALEDSKNAGVLEAEEDPNLEITTFRELAPVVNRAFTKALKARLADTAFVDKLGDSNAASRPESCTVLWQEESAEWKVHDPRDGTEVTFGSLLQDVCRYWGVHHSDMVFTDADGAAWPLEM